MEQVLSGTVAFSFSPLHNIPGQVALLLLLVGVYGLLFEGYNPGAIVPGVVGVVCLLFAAYALQVIPVNYAGLALIIVGILLIVAEAFVPSFGASSRLLWVPSSCSTAGCRDSESR